MVEHKVDPVLVALTRIEDQLDKIAKLMQINYSAKILETKQSLLGQSKIRKEVYGLCDEKHSVSQMASIIKRPAQNVSRALSELEESGLIKELKIPGEPKVFSKVFE